MNKTQKVAALQARGHSWAIAWAGVELIALNEDCFLTCYLCQANRWTWGWGETKGAGPGKTCTQAQADQWLQDEIAEIAQHVLRACTVPPTANQLSAMVCLAYNIGIAAFRSSSVLKAHNRGDHIASARAFALWNKYRKAPGGPLLESSGLTSRRAAEAALYLQPGDDEPAERSVQAIEPESRLTASPITAAGATTVGTGVIAGASELGDQVSSITPIVHQASGLVQSLGVQPRVLLAIVLIVAGAAVVYWRWKQRNGGWT